MRDTIFALATAPGRAALAVMRLSGPGAGPALTALAGVLPAPRMASVRRLRDASGVPLDEALALWMPGPASFTGEDVVELHLHGGRAVTAKVSEALLALGLRPADPGEFTRRAFERGRLDLSEAEAVADLVDAETEAQRRQALDQLDGGLSRRAAAWRDALIDALASLEAAIDFPDEDLPKTVRAAAVPPLKALLADLRAAKADRRGAQVRDGFHVALIGAPNAGKSTLLNLLAGREAAIVTAVPGTTRDVIEVVLDLAGYRVIVADTAGLRETDDIVEREGVRRAQSRAESADLRLWVVDGSDDDALVDAPVKPGDILVLAKTDLPRRGAYAAARAAAKTHRLHTVGTSDRDTGLGAALAEVLTDRAVAAMAGSEGAPLSRERHRVALEDAIGHVARALSAPAPELMAEDVRLAARRLEQISGRVDNEAVLDRVFASFCIGK